MNDKLCVQGITDAGLTFPAVLKPRASKNRIPCVCKLGIASHGPMVDSYFVQLVSTVFLRDTFICCVSCVSKSLTAE